MILIRGIKGEQYARKIEKGIVDCRDILSALLEPPVTGYEFSDYYEKNLVKALSFCWNGKMEDIHNPEFLYPLFIDYFVPHIYLTYFHVLNQKTIEWLDNFDDDYSFIAVDVQLDRLTKTAIGSEYFGAKMSYVNSIRELDQDGYNPFQTACMCSIEDLFSNKAQMITHLRVYNTLSFALLCREKDEKFTDIENEFRIIAYDCPSIVNGKLCQHSREATLTGKTTGIKYKGLLNADENTVFESNTHVFQNPYKWLSDILIEEKGMVTLNSKFKSIDISAISDDYKYIGDKKECAEFIKKSLACKYRERYVNRTIQKKYKIEDVSDAVFVPVHMRVDY